MLFYALNNSHARRIMLPIVDSVHPRRCATTVTVYGTRLSVDTSNTPERILSYCPGSYYRAYWRSRLGRFLRRTLQPGDVFVDAGAHIGMYSLIARHLGAAPIPIDPDPVNAAFLRRNAAAIASVRQLAVGNRRGRVRFHIGNDENRDAGSLVGFASDDRRAVYDREAEVAMERLDALLMNHPVAGAPGHRIAVVKIDVEGAEADAVEGMTGLFERETFPDVWCEVRGSLSTRNPMSAVAVHDLMTRFGYETLDTATELPIESVTDYATGRGVFDVLLRHRSR